MPATTSRREFLGQGAGALGLLAGIHGRPAAADDKAPVTPAANEAAANAIERGVAFLRPRQDAKGGWSTQREPGVTALVVTALLRSGRVTPGDPLVTKALAYLEGFIGPKGGSPKRPTPITRRRSRFWHFRKPTSTAATIA